MQYSAKHTGNDFSVYFKNYIYSSTFPKKHLCVIIMVYKYLEKKKVEMEIENQYYVKKGVKEKNGLFLWETKWLYGWKEVKLLHTKTFEKQ